MSKSSAGHKYGERDISIVNSHAHLGDRAIILNIDCHSHCSMAIAQEADSHTRSTRQHQVRTFSESPLSKPPPLGAEGNDQAQKETYFLDDHLVPPNRKRTRTPELDSTNTSEKDGESITSDNEMSQPCRKQPSKRPVPRRIVRTQGTVEKARGALSRLIYTDVCDQLLNVPDVHPESYTLSNINGSILVCTTLESQFNPGWKRWLIFYARSSRSWERIVIDLVSESSEHSEAHQMRTSAHTWGGSITIPNALGTLVRSILPYCKIHKGGTQLTLAYTEGDIDKPLLSRFETRACDSANKAALFEEEQLLEFARTNQCPVFNTCEVCVERQVSVSEYIVWVRSVTCLELRYPFVTMGHWRRRRQDFCVYCDGIKLLIEMRNSPSTVQIHGVILAEDQRTIRGFLKERPVIHSMHNFLLSLTFYGLDVPPFLRGLWVRDVIRAISEMHQAGKVVGFFKLSNIRMQRDGTAIFDPYFNVGGSAPLFDGNLPPELRPLRVSDRRAYELSNDYIDTAALWVQSMDIFVLGSVLWCIAEGHCRMTSAKICARAACSSRVRYSCLAEHADPLLLLPPCREESLEWVDIIVNMCRQPNPEDRPSTEGLLEALDHAHLDSKRDGTCISKFVELAQDIEHRNAIISANCCGCGHGMARGEENYHCDICSQGDFDLCGKCTAQEVHCWDRSHRLRKVTHQEVCVAR